MSDTTFTHSDVGASVTGRPRPLETILLGGLVVGILDMLFAFVFYWLILGAPRLRIFQNVAAGLLGRDVAFAGGERTFWLGLLLHFVVATCITTVYYLMSLGLPFLIRHAVPSGLIYGLIAYLVMNYIVVPLSAIGPSTRPFNLTNFLTAFIAHAFLVGLPVALLARWSAKRIHSSA